MEERFASELLHEVKSSAKRWFIAFCIMVGLEVFTIIGFMWYMSLPIEEEVYTTQNIEGDDNTEVHQIGGDYNESESN